MKVALFAAMMFVLPLAAAAQQASNPVIDALRQVEERQSKNLIAAADEMPADKFSFSPTPQQMSFGHLILHIATSNNFLCSKIGNVPMPQAAKVADTDPKDKLVAALKDSFDFCSSALGKATDAHLGEEIDFFGGRKATRAMAALSIAADWGDHYSAAAMYLRLNGMLPPTAKKKGE